MIRFRINGIPMEAEEGTTILSAAKTAGIRIPTLCYLEGINEIGSCRMCLVEEEWEDRLFTACNTTVKEGMKLLTDSPRVVEARRMVLDLLLSNHNVSCFSCPSNGRCELQDLCYEYGIDLSSYEGTRKKIERPPVEGHPFLSYRPDLCIHCQRCVSTCEKATGRKAISLRKTGMFF